MASILRKVCLSNPVFKQKKAALVVNAVRNHWNYQYKPGPYPKTKAEYEAAAKKYGLTVEEYKPYPEEEGYGDYPHLPDIGADSKDNYYPYDFPEMKRNFNEPIHAWAEIIGEDRYDISAKYPIPLWRMWLWFFGVVGGSAALFFFLENYKMGRPVLMKQYPSDGKSYTFEKA